MVLVDILIGWFFTGTNLLLTSVCEYVKLITSFFFSFFIAVVYERIVSVEIDFNSAIFILCFI